MDDKKTAVLMIVMIILCACTTSYLTMDRVGRIHLEQRYEVNITGNNTIYEVYLPIPKKMDDIEMVEGTGEYSITDTEYGRALRVISSEDTRLIGNQDHYGNTFWRVIDREDHALSMGTEDGYQMYLDGQSSVTVNITLYTSLRSSGAGEGNHWSLDHILESGWNGYALEDDGGWVTDSYPFFYHLMIFLNIITWIIASILIHIVIRRYRRKDDNIFTHFRLRSPALFGVIGSTMFFLGVLLLAKGSAKIHEPFGLIILSIGVVLTCGFGGSGFERLIVQISGSEEMGHTGFIIGSLIGIGFFMNVLFFIEIFMQDIRIYFAYVLVLFVLVFGGLTAWLTGLYLEKRKDEV